MEKIKVAFIDFWPEITQENIFLPILRRYFDVEETSVNPDVVFHSIFGGMKETPKYNCKMILFLGENHRPSSFKTDYSISFDPHTEKNYRLPLWQVYLIINPMLKEKLFGPRINHKAFDNFCSFTVSNSGNSDRNNFFHHLNTYKKVKSYGRCMPNDLSLIKASENRYWRDAKYEFFLKNTHKYAIAFENNSYPYYTTEKLMDAFLAGSMPIYRGDPKVKEDWNVNAFINANKGLDYALNKIKEMEYWEEGIENSFSNRYTEPIFTPEQKERHLNNMNDFETWLINVIKK